MRNKETEGLRDTDAIKNEERVQTVKGKQDIFFAGDASLILPARLFFPSVRGVLRVPRATRCQSQR